MPECPLCGSPSTPGQLAEAAWLAPDVLNQLALSNPHWRRSDGACPACVQRALLGVLLNHGEAALHERIQQIWPLDAEAAFGALPTPLRMHADPRFTGQGITIALVDSGFYPHPDLVRPRNRIRAWVDAGCTALVQRCFSVDETPTWPSWDAAAPQQWHGLMTSTVAAGNGQLSHGFYRGMACGLLTRHPEVLARLQAEVDAVLCGRTPTFADLPGLAYTSMVIQETMRLRPPAWFLTRGCGGRRDRWVRDPGGGAHWHVVLRDPSASRLLGRS